MKSVDEKYLDNEEKELIESLHNDEWKSVENLKEEMKRYQSYAKYQIENNIDGGLPKEESLIFTSSSPLHGEDYLEQT